MISVIPIRTRTGCDVISVCSGAGCHVWYDCRGLPRQVDRFDVDDVICSRSISSVFLDCNHFQILIGLKLDLLPISGFDGPLNYILPSIALGTRYAGSIARITRTSMLDVIKQDYIRTARSKGVKESLVIMKHALKNAMIPIVTLVGTELGKI